MNQTKYSSGIPTNSNPDILGYYIEMFRNLIKRVSDINDQVAHDDEVKQSTRQSIALSLTTAKEALHEALTISQLEL